MIVLDLETKPQKNLVDMFTNGISVPKTYKDEEKINAYIDKKKQESVKLMSVDPDYADILCVGIKDLETGHGDVYEGKELPDLLKKYEKKKIITFNGKTFDMPVIIKYGVKHGLDLPYKRLKDACRKWGTYGGHYDLMEAISNGKFKSLDEYAQIYLGREKTPIDFESADDKEIKKHCLEDLDITEQLFNKFEPLFI